MYLLAVGLSVYAIQWLLVGHAGLVSTLLYTFIAGNSVALLVSAGAPLYDRPFPRNWIVFLALLLPVSILSSALGGLLDRLILRMPLRSLGDWRTGDIPFGALIVFGLAAVDFVFITNRARLQEANLLLEQQVQRGQQTIEVHAAELRAAYDIQSSLLPRSIPQIAGVEISCAWQPARTVSGDFFDVVILGDGLIGFCVADVSGKGMSAALITANLQATFRAFVQTERSPASLCDRLNQALCANLPPGRFVTFAYGILDRRAMTMTYELAGHNPPLLLRSGRATGLQGSGPVLGLLPDARFQDNSVALESGDCLLLPTDGVTEAFNPEMEEFGEERLIATALRAGGSAHNIRQAAMQDVTEFAQGQFHDDASLMVVRITG